MTATGPSEAMARRAKNGLAKKFAGRDWCRGVGIVPTAEGLGLRINVDPDADVEDEIPASYYRIPVEVVRIKEYRPRKL